MPLKHTIIWLNSLDGRDRLTKLFQYISLILSYYCRKRNKPEFHQRFLSLYKSLRSARQAFRLFKYCMEWGRIKYFYNKSYHDEFDRLCNITQSTLYFIYWFIDNVVILCSFKFLTWQTKPIYKVALLFRFLAAQTGLLLTIRTLLRLHHSEIKIRISLPDIHVERENQDAVHKISEIKIKKNICWINFFKSICDSIVAGDGAEVWKNLGNLEEIWIGLAGFISAFLTSYYKRNELEIMNI